MVTFQFPASPGVAAPHSFSVKPHSVAFAGSRHSSVPDGTAAGLVQAFSSLGFSFLTGCAPGIDACFRKAFSLNASIRSTSYIACAFEHRARRYAGSEIYASVVVPPGLTPAAALHRRTVWMIRRCSLLVLVPEHPVTKKWGNGSTLAFHSALLNLKPVFVASTHPPKPSQHYLLHSASLFDLVDGWWVVPHPVAGGTCDEIW